MIDFPITIDNVEIRMKMLKIKRLLIGSIADISLLEKNEIEGNSDDGYSSLLVDYNKLSITDDKFSNINSKHFYKLILELNELISTFNYINTIELLEDEIYRNNCLRDDSNE